MSPKNSHNNQTQQPFANHKNAIHQNSQMQNSHQPQSNNAVDHILAENDIQEQTNGPGSNDQNEYMYEIMYTGDSRGIRPEDVLWWICFFFTARCFDLPAILIFNRKVDGQFLQIAFCICPLLLALFTLFFSIFKSIFGNAASRWLCIIQLFAILCFFGTPLFFCLATWYIFGIWSIFIAYVAVQSTLAFIAVIF